VKANKKMKKRRKRLTKILAEPVKDSGGFFLKGSEKGRKEGRKKGRKEGRKEERKKEPVPFPIINYKPLS
jgi:predicted transposase YdaD